MQNKSMPTRAMIQANLPRTVWDLREQKRAPYVVSMTSVGVYILPTQYDS